MLTHTQNSATNSATESQINTDVLIIGAGLAGLSTALSLPKHMQVMVLAKEDLFACSSNYAQGGIAAVVDNNDNIDEHVSDTLIAGDGLCDKEASTAILSQGSNAIEWLIANGVPFTTETTDHIEINANTIVDKRLVNKKLAALHLTQEGGHGRRRVVHADDATGKHIMQTLHSQVSSATNITVLPYHEALNLLTQQTQPNTSKHCYGATVLDMVNQNIITFTANAVVLASGGLGKLFSRATAPDVCMGDGIMMAWEAGCRLANLEFVQFHPTGLVANDSNFLISEAVRGEGGYLLCPIRHERFMSSYDKRAELAPRDIVARAISEQITQNGLGYVHLDISHQPADFVRQHFPDIYAHCLNLGIDITKHPIPVAPTAHYTCGGVVTTVDGLTDVVGLYAAGEVAHTGLHGANRLASNSLLECVVVGQKIAKHIPTYVLNNKNQWQKPIIAQTLVVDNVDIDINGSNITTNLLSRSITDTNELKTLMTHYMGIHRTQVQLQQALARVMIWRTDASLNENSVNKNCPNKNYPDKNSIEVFRINRLLILASLMLQSALSRNESRGGHYRNDYPNLTSTPAISVIYPYNLSAKVQTSKVNDNSVFNLEDSRFTPSLSINSPIQVGYAQDNTSHDNNCHLDEDSRSKASCIKIA